MPLPIRLSLPLSPKSFSLWFIRGHKRFEEKERQDRPERALELFKLPRALGETAEGEKVTVAIGRFGPYIKYGDKFVSLGKDDDPYTVNLETALSLVAEKK